LPSDINEFTDAIKADVNRQYGVFSGTTRSGDYIVNNVRASYRVAPVGNPDFVEFAFYYEDAWTGSLNRVTRGSANFSFSFAKPADMNKALESLKSGIAEKKGSFSGDVNNGNFRAQGLAGQYSVSDKVNVTITEKPPLIPNSLIEKETISFFNK